MIIIYIVGKQHCCRKSALSVLAVKAVLAQAWFVCSYALCRSFLNQTSVIGYSQEYLPLHFLKLTSLHFWGPTDQELPKAILFTRLQDSAPKKIGMQQWSASKVDFWAFLTTVLHLLSQCEGLLHDAWCMLWWNLGKRTWVTWSPQIKAFAPQFQLIQLWMLSDKSENNLQTTSNIFKHLQTSEALNVFGCFSNALTSRPQHHKPDKDQHNCRVGRAWCHPEMSRGCFDESQSWKVHICMYIFTLSSVRTAANIELRPCAKARKPCSSNIQKHSYVVAWPEKKNICKPMQAVSSHKSTQVSTAWAGNPPAAARRSLDIMIYGRVLPPPSYQNLNFRFWHCTSAPPLSTASIFARGLGHKHHKTT